MHPDANVYVVALVLALVSGILFGLVPVRQVLRTDPYQIIKAGSTGTAGRRLTVRDLLLVVQVAICAVLVTSSMVAVRGMVRSLHGNFGFEPRNAHADEHRSGYGGLPRRSVPAMQKRMIDAMETIPGVTSVALVERAASGSGLERLPLSLPTKRPICGRRMPPPEPFLFRISPEYFHAARTALLSGRTSPGMTMTMRRAWPSSTGVCAQNLRLGRTDAIGRYYQDAGWSAHQVVGIVEDGKYMSLTEDPQPAMFFPILQSPID